MGRGVLDPVDDIGGEAVLSGSGFRGVPFGQAVLSAKLVPAMGVLM